MFDVCLRCGNRILPGQAKSAVTLHGEQGHQHAACGDYHRGTNVHYRHEPWSKARQEVYSHDWGDGKTFVFNVSSLRWRAIHGQRETITLDIDLTQLEGMMKAREMTPEHAMAVVARRVAQGTFDDPGILVYHPHRGGSLIVDGNHRYVGRAMVGERTMRFYVFDYSEMGFDVLEGVDPSLIERFTVTDTRWGV